MRILLITTSYSMENDGSEAAGSFVADFASELVAQGNNVAVAFPTEASSAESGTQSESGARNPTFFAFNVPSVPLSTLSVSNPADWLKIVSTLRSGDRSVSNAIDSYKPDFVFALWALPSGYWAFRHCRRSGIKYGIWALGSDIWSLGKIPIVKNILSRTLRCSEVNFADGLELVRDVEIHSGGSCGFLPSTRKLDKIQRKSVRSEAPYRLSYIGRWHPNKGIDILLDALNLLDENAWKSISSISIAGGGPLEAEVKQKVASLVEQGRPLTLTGYVDKKEASAMLSETDYLLIPSRIESIPVVFSDAMQADCPVVATPVGDLPELIQRYNCGVVAVEITVDSYAEALSSALSQSAHIHSPGVRSAGSAFSLDVIVENFIQTIRK